MDVKETMKILMKILDMVDKIYHTIIGDKDVEEKDKDVEEKDE